MIKNNNWIVQQCLSYGLVTPFVPELVSKDVISYGVGSFGYDLRLSPKDFRIFLGTKTSHVTDPKDFCTSTLTKAEMFGYKSDEQYFIVPANTCALGVTLEKVTIPANVTAICVGKSTYARCGLVANVTPIEAGWSGHITIELSNTSLSPIRVYAKEGIVQLLFFEGETPSMGYKNRKYQNQLEEVTLPRV